MRRNFSIFLIFLSIAVSPFLVSCSGLEALYLLYAVMPNQNINFHGKVIDQYGKPVPGVIVKYAGHHSSAYSSDGSGSDTVVTDNEGRFKTNGAEGGWLSIDEFTKPGYQFAGEYSFYSYKRFEDSVLWQDFTKDKPYVFKAWKIEHYPKVIAGGTTFTFELGTLYSMDFTASSLKQVKKKGDFKLDLQVMMDRDDSGWKVKLSVPDGGLIETNDYYLNLAPANGYKKELSYSGSQKEYFDLEKKYYIHSRGKIYGNLVATLWPYYRDISAIKFHYVMNLENSRNLVVTQDSDAVSGPWIFFPKAEVGLPKNQVK